MTMPCAQKPACPFDAVAVMRWPGAPWSPICKAHLAKAKAIAEAMGFELECRISATGQEENGAATRTQLLEIDDNPGRK